MIADVSWRLGATRDQGRRPTSMSFATSDVHQASRQHPKRFSTDALHCEAAKLTGKGFDQAVSSTSIFDVLRTFGQVEEGAWPYGSYEPIDKGAMSFQAFGNSAPFDETSTIMRIENGFPVGVILRIGEEFFYADGTNAISLKSFSKVQALHAVVIVAVRKGTEGKEFLIRNSWGCGWASNGHCWAEAQYLKSLSVTSFEVRSI